MAEEDLKAELARLKAETSGASAAEAVTLRVSEKGGVSVYGLGAFR